MAHRFTTTRRGSRGVLVFGIAAAAAAVLAGPAGAQEPFPGLDAYVARAMAAWKVPGLGLAIVRNDSVIYAKGYGVQRVGATTPVNENTLFEIGSSSKSFTATVVAMLVSDGKMKFDERVSTYLPGFRLYDPVANAELTIRDALTHRSGLSRGELAWLDAGVSRAEVLHRVQFHKPTAHFRSKFQYQNMMFLAAGEAAAKAANSTWEDLVQQRIFTPLGMTSSLPLLPSGAQPANFASPHGRTKDSVWAKPHMSIDNVAPAGSIISSARDMAQYLRFQLGDGSFGGKRLLKASDLRETHTPQIVVGGALGALDSLTMISTYGMGWIIEDYRGAIVRQHGGNTDGMTAAMGVLPRQKFGVVVLANLAGTQLPDILMHWLFDRQLGAPMNDLSAAALARAATQRRRADSLEKVQQAGVPAMVAPPIPLASFVGEYADSLYGKAVVTQENGQLMMARGLWSAPLEPGSYGTFKWGPLQSAVLQNIVLRYDITPQGKVAKLWFNVGDDVISFARVEKK